MFYNAPHYGSLFPLKALWKLPWRHILSEVWQIFCGWVLQEASETRSCFLCCWPIFTSWHWKHMIVSPFHHYCRQCERDFVNRDALRQVWRFLYYIVPVQLILESITAAHSSMKTVTVINATSSLTRRMIWTRWDIIQMSHCWLTSNGSISEILKNIHIVIVVRRRLAMTTTWMRWVIYCKDCPFTLADLTVESIT